MTRFGHYPRADLRGRPPFAPFNRAAATLAGDFVRLAMRASWLAIHLRVPKMPDTKAGTKRSTSKAGQGKLTVQVDHDRQTARRMTLQMGFVLPAT
jgi:hypothetical protein